MSGKKIHKLKTRNIWTKNILNRRIQLPFKNIGSNVRENILNKLEENLYNKCSKEGYIKNKSINILTYSSGLVEADNVIFDVSFECLICHPVEGQNIKCRVKNITRAGIRASFKEKENPITIFIARDHHYNNESFSKIKENDDITIIVIGIRYELYDETICVLGELKSTKGKKSNPKIQIG